MLRKSIQRWLKRFADRHAGEDETVEGLKNLGNILGLNAILMGLFFFGFDGILTWPDNDGDVDSWHLDPLGFGIWGFLFPAGGIWLLTSTFLMKGVVKSHIFLALVWLIMGIVWVTYSFVFRPDYVFGIGVLAIFTSAQHFVYARLWKAEGVE